MSMSHPQQAVTPLYIESSGQGEDVVLIHGWGMHGGYWQDIVDALQDQYRMHCIDLPGHGNSDYHNETALDEFVSRIKNTIDAITHEPVHLIGWSLGGLMSQQLCLRYPERVKSLTLIASSACFMQRNTWPTAMQKDVLQGFADSLLQDYQTSLNRFLALQVMGSEDQKQILRDLKSSLFSRGEPDQQALMAGLNLLKEVDLRSMMSAISVPVQLVGGERDKLVPHTALPCMAELLNTREMHIIKGAGHAPFLSHPQQLIKIIQSFLSHE